MTNLIVLVSIASFWIFILFLDNIFKSCMLPPYVRLLQNGVEIKPGIIQIYTTRWNRCLQKWSCRKPKLQQKWFDFGVYSALILLPISVFVLLNALKQTLNTALLNDQSTLNEEEENIPIIQPVLPGINIPFHDIPYYLLTLLLCSVFHELGHAIAATREDVKVQGFGFFFMGIFPGAFVDLPSDQIIVLTPWQQLRIFTAGVWHNIAIVFLAAILLLVTPFLTLPFYQRGNGIQVLTVEYGSGINGLYSGDILKSLNDCPILDFTSWHQCLKDISKLDQKGYCLENNFIINNIENEQFKSEVNSDNNNNNCCGQNSQSNLCFERLKDNKFICLPARKALESSTSFCNVDNVCVNSENCLKPLINSNFSRLISINKQIGKSVIFFGPPEEIFKAVSVSNYISRHWLSSTRLIHIWETFLKYMIAFSGALAILNIVPCFYLDGTYILKALIDLSLINLIQSSKTRWQICFVLTSLGTILLGLVVLSGIASLAK